MKELVAATVRTAIAIAVIAGGYYLGTVLVVRFAPGSAGASKRSK